MFFHTANGIGFTYTDSAGRLPLILSMQFQHVVHEPSPEMWLKINFRSTPRKT